MKRLLPFFTAAAITGGIMVMLSFFIPDEAQARSTLCAGLIVAAVIAAIPIYDINSWSLAKRSLVHFLAMLVTVFPLLLISGWFTLPISIVVFLLFGAVGWTVGCIINRIQQKTKAESASSNSGVG